MKLKLNNVRLAFPHLFTEQVTVDEQTGKVSKSFNAAFILEPTSPHIAELNQAIDIVAKEKWGAKADAILKQMRAQDKVCLHDGDLKSNYEGYEGNMYVNSRSKMRPLVIDANKQPLAESDGRPYSGCYVNASVELWAQDNDNGKRVNAQLRGVQFFRDGEAFAGGGAASEDEFDDITSGATADDLV